MGYRLPPVVQASVFLFLDQPLLLLLYEHVMICPPESLQKLWFSSQNVL
jgi:hypothetical protein